MDDTFHVPGALTGLRVLDLTTLLPGPFCTLLLADFGADVIKVENPRGGGDPLRGTPNDPQGVDPAFAALNRNKRSIAIDLKQAEGRELLLELAAISDVLVEQFRPGVMDRLGLGYEVLSERNPRLIYVSITGFGQSGPYRDRPGHDLNYVALAGILGLMREPIPPGAQIADVAGGGLTACVGVLLALQERQRSGRGQYVDVSMLDGALATLVAPLARHLTWGRPPVPGGERLTGGLPWYDVYRTADGRYISLGALEPKFWDAFCRAVGREDWIPLHGAAGDKLEELRDALAELFQRKTLQQWLEELAGVDTCVAPVLSLDEVVADPQVVHRQLLFEGPAPGGGKAWMVRPPIRLSRTPGTVRSAAPRLGEHTSEILAQIGRTADEIADLRARGIVW